MYRRYFLASIGLVVSTWFVINVRSPLLHQDVHAADKSNESVDVRYARSYLTLARLDLQEAVDANTKHRGTYTADLIDRLRENVAVAEERLKQTLGANGNDLHAAHIRELEAEVTLAEAGLQRALTANKQRPGTVQASDIERLRVSAELARLALAKARDPAKIVSAEAHLQWQLSQLRQEVLRLRIRIEELTVRI